jgi:hypothetical protein
MYEGWTRLLIVFLTHPGVLVPFPAEGLYTWARGFFQATVALIMHSFSDGNKNQIASMVYWVILIVMAYIQVAIALSQSNT